MEAGLHETEPRVQLRYKDPCQRASARPKLVIVRLEAHLEPVSELPGRKCVFPAKRAVSQARNP